MKAKLVSSQIESSQVVKAVQSVSTSPFSDTFQADQLIQDILLDASNNKTSQNSTTNTASPVDPNQLKAMSLSDFLSGSKSQTLAEKVKESLKTNSDGTELVSKVRGHLESIIKFLLSKGGDITSADSSSHKVSVLESRIDDMLATPSSVPSLKLKVH